MKSLHLKQSLQNHLLYWGTADIESCVCAAWKTHVALFVYPSTLLLCKRTSYQAGSSRSSTSGSICIGVMDKFPSLTAMKSLVQTDVNSQLEERVWRLRCDSLLYYPCISLPLYFPLKLLCTACKLPLQPGFHAACCCVALCNGMACL